MKQEILNYLRQNPGARKREIAAALGKWQCDKEFLATMFALQVDGVITYETYKDPAQMEFYDKWFIVP